MLGYPPEQTPRSRPPRPGTPQNRPPLDQAPRPGADPPQSRHTPPGADPPGPGTPLGSKLQHTVNERPVCILLECILVSSIFTTRKRSLWQGNMFTGVFLSTGGVPAPGGLFWGVWSGGCLLPVGSGPGDACSGGCLLQGRCLLRGGAWWRPPDGYCCGRYASYWNAFLSSLLHGVL